MSGALSRPGAAPLPSASIDNLNRKNRIAQLALETVDIKNDPYFMKNHIGKYECKLCLTMHTNEANYMAHTQGKRHQTNLAQRAARMAALGKGPTMVPQAAIEQKKAIRRTQAKIGRPGYKVVKQKCAETGAKSLLFQLQYPQIEEGMRPRFRFMSAFEQRIEQPNDKFQYLLFAADPYETVSFKIPNMEIDKSHDKLFVHWDEDKHLFTLQLFFRPEAGSKGSKPISSAMDEGNDSPNPYVDA